MKKIVVDHGLKTDALMGFCLLVNLFKPICDYMYVFYIKKKVYTYVFHMNVYASVFSYLAYI